MILRAILRPGEYLLKSLFPDKLFLFKKKIRKWVNHYKEDNLSREIIIEKKPLKQSFIASLRCLFAQQNIFYLQKLK